MDEYVCFGLFNDIIGCKHTKEDSIETYAQLKATRDNRPFSFRYLD